MLTWIVSSSVLILAVLGLRLLFRGRISNRMTYALWALVLLRLLIPGSILPSTASVANLVTEFTAPLVFSAPVLEQEEALEQVLTEHQITQTDFDALPVTQQNTYTQQADALVESSRVEAQAEIQKQETRYYSTRQILLTLWGLGSAITAGCLLWANIRFGLALSRSRRRVAPAVYRSAATESPCLFGLFRPAVYLPEDLSEEDVPYVLAHEQTHLRHLDHIWSALRCLCLALHWFNPLVWIAGKVSRTDSELACDEGALERLGDENRETYGKVLIRMSRGQNGNLLLTATTMTSDKRTLYARVKAIAQKPRILAAAVVLLGLTAAIIVGCTFTGPESPADPTEPPETTEPTAPPETTEHVVTEPEIELPWNMMSALDSEFELDYQNYYIMALENVEVKYIPSDDAETIYELNNELVKLQAAVYGEPEKWVLVRYASTFDGGGNMGWVKISGLTEYTEERKAQLLFPVTVREGCKDVETGKELMQIEYGRSAQEGEYVGIGNEFGSFKVKAEDIRYPDTQKTTDRIWGEWESIKYVPQDPDTYPEGELQATAMHYMGLLYVRDNRADSLEKKLPEGYVWLGITRISERPGRPKFDLEGCHIPEGADVYGTPHNLDYLYYHTEKGWQRMIRAGLVENYWDDQKDPYRISGDTMVQWFHTLLNSYRADNLYNHAVGSWFETTADVNLYELFYNGFPEEKTKDFTSAEQDFLEKNLAEGVLGVSNTERLPVKTMDEVLRRYFGVRFKNTSGMGLERMDVYWSRTDCYYKWTSDVYSEYPVVEKVIADEENGIYAVYYYDGGTNSVKDHGKLTLKQKGDVLQVVSNLPVTATLQPITMPTVIHEKDLPSYDTDSKKNFVISQETYDGFRVDNIHMGTRTSYSMVPYDYGYLWVCTSEPEYNRGNRYELWAVEDGKVKKLDSKALSAEITVLGKTVDLYTEYVFDNGEIVFTYIPAPEYAWVTSTEDSSRWVVHLLLEDEKSYHNYWVMLNPKSGEITEFMQNFDPALLQGKDYQFVTWINGGFIARVYGEGYYFFDTGKGTITENYPYENPEDPGKGVTFQRKDDRGLFQDPFDGETVEIKLPEGWEELSSLNWHWSYDGRMTMAYLHDEQGRIRDILVFDGRSNRLYEIHRSGFPTEMKESINWSHDNRLVIYTEENRAEISVYTFD